MVSYSHQYNLRVAWMNLVISNFDTTFNKMKYIDENFEVEKLLESDTIHLPPFKKKIK